MQVNIEDIVKILQEAGEDTYSSNRPDRDKCMRIEQIEDISIKLCKLVGVDPIALLGGENG